MRFLTTVAVTVLLLPPSLADWQPCGPERLKQAYSVVVSPRNADVIFVLGQGRSIDEPLAYRSTDGGNTWHELLVGRSQPDVVHAVGSSESLYATIGLELYESRDDGASWVPIGIVRDPGIDLEQVRVFRLGVTSVELLAGVGNQRPRQSGGLFHSADQGKTWRAYPELVGRTIYDILVLEDETILVGTQRGVFRTRDGGATWENVGPEGVEARIRDLTHDPRTGAIYAGTSGRGVWRTTNLGASWVARNVGMRNPATYAVEVDFRGDGILWAGASGGGLYRSLDDGSTWTQDAAIGARTKVARIVFPASRPGFGFVATGDGLYCRSPVSTAGR